MPSGSLNAANELTASPSISSYSYDGDGNETGNSVGASFTYNGKNQTTAMTDNGQTLSSLTYSDVGQTQRTAAGGTTLASSPLGVQITTSGGSAIYYTRDNQGNLISERESNGTHWYFLEDGSGSVVGVTGPTGSATGDRYHYDPYGNVTLNTGVVDNVWGYAGGYTDTTGLVKFGTRYYDPSTGRWTQQDPVGGSIANPGTVNRYPYVSDNPINYADPSGKNGVDCFFASAGLLGGFLGIATILVLGFPEAEIGLAYAGLALGLSIIGIIGGEYSLLQGACG